MDTLKIAYIGAGSFRFATPLFRDLATLAIKQHMALEVGLTDIDAVSLRVMEKYFHQIIKKGAKKSTPPIKIHASTNRREVLENVDFVYKSISVGIQQSEWYDIYLPLKLGIPQNTGDTVGPGGLFRALRAISPVVDIVRDMQELCPHAILLNYTNPQSPLVLAARTIAPNISFIGICHELFDGMKVLQRHFRWHHHLPVSDWTQFDIQYGGINHFAWLTKLHFRDHDLYDSLRADAEKLMKRQYWGRGFNFHLLQRFGLYPYPGGRHIAEFLPDYYNYFNYRIQNPKWHFPTVRNVSLLAWERKIVYNFIHWVNHCVLIAPRAHPSNEKAVEMTMDWKSDNSRKHVVNVPNYWHGSTIIPGLPEDSIVEIPARFLHGEMTPVGQINLPSSIIDLLRPHCEQQRLTVEAGLKGDPNQILRAMQHDPMNKWIEDPDRIDFLTKMMLYYEREWLPEAWHEWIPTKEELQQHPWWIPLGELVKDYNNYLHVKAPVEKFLREKAFFWGK